MNVVFALRGARRSVVVATAVLLGMSSTARPSAAVVAGSSSHRPAPECMRFAPASAGMIAAIDPETGLLAAPDAGQRERLASRAARVSAGPRPAPTRLPNGTLRLDVRSWMRDFAVVRLGLDGRPTFGCVDDKAAIPGTATRPAGAEVR